MKIAAYVMFCEADLRWLDGFLENAEMMDVDLGWQLDHCSEETKEKIRNHPRSKVVLCEDNLPFLERFRSKPFHALQALGYDWLFHWDIDERWDPSAKDKMRQDIENAQDKDLITFPMFTAWEDKGTLRLRIDSIFAPDTNGTQTNRQRMYNAKNDWKWLDPITVGPYKMIDNTPAKDWTAHKGTAPIIHLGCKDEELRKSHKIRWDDNYTRAVGRQPYGFWDFINDPTREVTLADFKEYGLQQIF